MTEGRPERSQEWGSGQDPYAGPGAFEAAVESLHDPLTDPLPRPPAPPAGPAPYPDGTYPGTGYAAPAHDFPAHDFPAHDFPAHDTHEGQSGYDGWNAGTDAFPTAGYEPYHSQDAGTPAGAYLAPSDEYTSPVQDPETMGLRRLGDVPSPDGVGLPAQDHGGRLVLDDDENRAAADGQPGSAAEPGPPIGGGRAARRKAAKAAAKAARQTGTVISNVIGELFITTGVVLMLFVTYQLWWTNVEARAHAKGQADSLQEQWDSSESEPAEDSDREPGTFSPGEGFAILYLPTLDVRVPIAESVDESTVLDRGMTGHYTEEDRLPTAMPWDEEGNFGLAGHRNTHGEPFRYINKLEPGDPMVVETESTYYTYEMASRLDSTAPSNISVLDPVPEQGGFSEPGRYLTLTTCTPEFTSTYRLIVWGEMTEERPRSEGKPDALLD